MCVCERDRIKEGRSIKAKCLRIESRNKTNKKKTRDDEKTTRHDNKHHWNVVALGQIFDKNGTKGFGLRTIHKYNYADKIWVRKEKWEGI